MKLGIMQPYLFPHMGYWQLLNAVDKYVIYDDVNFIKGGWINRNKILMNGEEKMISLHLYNASPNKLINEVEVLGNPIHNRKLLKTIESCYKKAPYYSDVAPIIESIINNKEKNLASYLEYSIRIISEYLLIDTELLISSSIRKDNDLKAQDKVIEICEKLGAKEYYNAIGGQDLYSYDTFNAHNINLQFLESDILKYKQFDNEFVTNLSIIDVMMFNSTEEIQHMLGLYKLL